MNEGCTLFKGCQFHFNKDIFTPPVARVVKIPSIDNTLSKRTDFFSTDDQSARWAEINLPGYFVK